MHKLLLGFLLFVHPAFLLGMNSQKKVDTQKWSWAWRMSLGFAVKKENTLEGIEYSIPGPIFEYGLEKAWWYQDFYFAADLTWNIFYPDSFRTVSLEPYKIWLIPITHFHLGYQINKDMLVTIGSAYLWAVAGSFRFKVAENLFLEAKYVKWLDEPLENDWPLHQAIHDSFVTFGVFKTL